MSSPFPLTGDLSPSRETINRELDLLICKLMICRLPDQALPEVLDTLTEIVKFHRSPLRSEAQR